MITTPFRRLWLILCLILLAGLATAVPVNCVCDADQHWGRSVHPLFEHHHGEGQSHAAGETASTALSSSDARGSAAFVASEHGSLLGVTVDGLLFGRANLWLALSLLPLITLLPSTRRAYAAAMMAPPTGPPRLRARFS